MTTPDPTRAAMQMDLPKHKFWRPNEPNCPPELLAPNGELCDMRCKVCGDGWRQSTDVCFGAAPAQPAAWLHTVKQHGGDGTEDFALSFAPDNFPLQGEGGGMFYSVGQPIPLYTHTPVPTVDGVPAAPAPPRAAMQQALEALEGAIAWDKTRNFIVPYKVRDPMHAAISALRASLALPAEGAEPPELPPLSDDHRRLMKFYGVITLRALVNAQAHHIEKLQAKLPVTPSLAPNRVREG